jgi:hypothetical protein
VEDGKRIDLCEYLNSQNDRIMQMEAYLKKIQEIGNANLIATKKNDEVIKERLKQRLVELILLEKKT